LLILGFLLDESTAAGSWAFRLLFVAAFFGGTLKLFEVLKLRRGLEAMGTEVDILKAGANLVRIQVNIKFKTMKCLSSYGRRH
jgi:hypothetical protein